MSNSVSQYKGFIFVFIMSLSWAFNVVIAGYSITNLGVNAYLYGAQTLITAAILMGVYIIFKNNTSEKKVIFTKSDIIWMLLLGLFANGVGNLFTLKGIAHSANNYAFLIKTSIVFSIVLEIILKQQKANIVKFIVSGFLLLGAYIMSTDGKLILPNKYDLYTIISAAFFGFTIVLSKTVNTRNSPEYMSFYRALAGGLFLLVAAIFLKIDVFVIKNLQWGIFGGFLVFILFLSMFKALEIKEASYVSMVSLMFSPMVLLISYIAFGKTISIWQLLGGFIVLASIVALEIHSKYARNKGIN